MCIHWLDRVQNEVLSLGDEHRRALLKVAGISEEMNWTSSDTSH